MSNTIDSEDIAFGKLYEDYYTVPNYQREYVWAKEQVELLLNDIYSEFDTSDILSTELKSEYFVGSIVVCPRGENGQMFDLIDGQQRTTTTYILLCAIRDRLIELSQIPMADLLTKISSTSTNMDGDEVHRYRLELQYEDSKDVLIKLANKTITIEPENNDTLSIKNIKNAYRTIKSFLTEKFSDDPVKLKRFYAYFINKVKIIRIKTGSVTHALKIFETINDRGRALDAMDLLKNLMFMSASPEEFEQLKSLWKMLTDKLYSVNEKPLRFLRYFIFASFDVDLLREDEIYTWLSKNAVLCGYKENPKAFVTRLIKAAEAHVNFIYGNNANGKFDRYITNIAFLSGTARQHFILLLAAKHLKDEAFSLLAQNIENLLFAYIISRESTKEFERLFARWAIELRKTNSIEDVQAFVEKNIRPAKVSLAQRFTAAIGLITFNSIQFYRLRYVIGKMTQYLNEKAFGDSGSNNQLLTFINRTVDIEHILSQTLTEENVGEFDNRTEVPIEERIKEAEAFVQKLGNLTLIEKTLNTSLSCKPYSLKHPVYKRSQYLITNSIGDNSNIGKATSYDKAISQLKSFDIWNKDALFERQKMITSLAHQVWDMPEANS